MSKSNFNIVGLAWVTFSQGIADNLEPICKYPNVKILRLTEFLVNGKIDENSDILPSELRVYEIPLTL